MNTQQGLTDEGKPTVATPIIIIDDDPKLCEFYKDYLEPLGYDVATAHTGPDGLEKVLQGNFSAVILDVMLPGMDGFEVLREIRRESEVPVLMLTVLASMVLRIPGLTHLVLRMMQSLESKAFQFLVRLMMKTSIRMICLLR